MFTVKMILQATHAVARAINSVAATSTLAPAAAAAAAPIDPPASTVTVWACHFGCGTFSHPTTASILTALGAEGSDDCPVAARAAPPTVSHVAEAGGTNVVPQLTTPDLLTLVRSMTVATHLQLNQERDQPATAFGDPTLRTAGKSRDRTDLQCASLAELYATRGAAILAAVLDALHSLPVAAAASLPVVDLGRPLKGALASPADARVPMAVAIASALQAALTSLGVTTFSSHAHASAHVWKGTSAPAFVFDGSGNIQPVSFFWSTISRMARNDEATRIPSDLYAVPTSFASALSGVASEVPIRAHGPLAGILPIAPRLGLLRAARHDPAAHAPLGMFWAAWAGALMDAAAQARKDFKNMAAPTRALPAPSWPTPAHPKAVHGQSQYGGAPRSPCPHCSKTHAPPCRLLAAKPAPKPHQAAKRQRT